MEDELITYQNPKSPISEIFKTLRTNIQFMAGNKQEKVFLITSSVAREGKSWTSANLAVAFAQTGKRVLLIDADMRRGRQYAIFNVSRKPGLSNFLSGIDAKGDTYTSEENINEFIQETVVENLYIMTAGNIPPNPSELLISSQMTNLMEQAREWADIVIIDGTPCQLVTDSIIISRLADSTIIVSACNETKKEDLKNIITNIQNVGGKISGVVLNKKPISSKEYQEGYYYGPSSNASKVKKKKKKNRH